MSTNIKSVDQILGDYLKSTPPPQEQQPDAKVESSQEGEKEISNVAPTPAETQAKPDAPEATATDEDFKLEEWDDQPEPAKSPEATQTKTESKFDFSSLVKDTGFEDVKDEAEFKAKVKELKLKPSELEGVPDTLKKAIELAKKGGDYLSYLGVSKVDYTKIDPDQAFMQYAVQQLGEEQAKELYDSKSPLERKLEGKKILEGWQSWQRQQESQFEAQAAQAAREAELKREKANMKLQETINKVDEIAGLKLKPHHKTDIYDAITSGRMQQELFFDKNTGDYDYKGMVETYFVKKNLPKILSHIEKATRSSTKKEILKDLSNAQIEKPSEKPQVKEDTRTPIEKYNDSFIQARGLKS